MDGVSCSSAGASRVSSLAYSVDLEGNGLRSESERSKKKCWKMSALTSSKASSRYRYLHHLIRATPLKTSSTVFCSMVNGGEEEVRILTKETDVKVSECRVSCITSVGLMRNRRGEKRKKKKEGNIKD